MEWKNTNQECKTIRWKSHIHYQDIYEKPRMLIGVYANNSSTVVYGGDILSFHIAWSTKW